MIFTALCMINCFLFLCYLQKSWSTKPLKRLVFLHYFHKKGATQTCKAFLCENRKQRIWSLRKWCTILDLQFALFLIENEKWPLSCKLHFICKLWDYEILDSKSSTVPSLQEMTTTWLRQRQHKSYLWMQTPQECINFWKSHINERCHVNLIWC